MTLLFILSFFTLLLSAAIVSGDLTTTRRRILHQPLFPVTSQPPPETQFPPPETPTPDHPFFNENQITPDQPQSQPPPPPTSQAVVAGADTVPRPIAPQPATKPAKKIAVAISVGIVTLGMLSGLAFFVYKHKSKHSGDSQKLNSRRPHQQNSPPATFLYIGTVDPPRPVTETTIAPTNHSPYHKLSSVKSSDRYRPSPDLQPLPPLTKPEPPSPPALAMSPSSSSSGEEETHDFYTPNGSISSTGSKQSLAIQTIPHSKRTSPRSRLSVSSSSPEKHFPATPPLAITYGPRRTKFAAPPPPPDMTRLNSRPPPPPPPPPPATMSAARKLRVSPMKTESRSPNRKVIPGIIKEMPVQEQEPERNNNGVEADDADGSKPKLKPLHWDKVRATSDRETVWDQIKSSSFQLNEDMIESLFGCNSVGSGKKEETRKPVLPPVEKENRVLDPKKSQNIAILLRALNVTRDEVSEALLDGNPEGLGAELLETLVKMAPTKEEEIKLRDYKGDVTKLGSAERFLKTILGIPFAFKRVEAMLYRANFETEIKYLRTSFQTLEEASKELKNNRLFLKLLEAVLRTGNRMNIGTNRGKATAFKLDTLLKLVDIKGTDGKTTLLHFVVQEIIRSEGTNSDAKTNPRFNDGLQVVSGLSRELTNVKKSAGMDSDILSSYVTKLETGLNKIRLTGREKPDPQGNFFDSMKTFFSQAEIEIAKIKIDERKVLGSVKDVTEYFHGDTAREGAQPFRIFMIVRDFLSVLDHVCKEVGQMQDRTMMGSTRSFKIPANASLPVLNRYNMHHNISSDEESSYSSS